MMKEDEKLDVPTLFEIMKDKTDLTYNEAEKLQEELRLKKEAGACITSGMKRDREATDKMKNKKDAEERIKELQIRLAEALEISEAHQKQMGKLQVRLTEVEEDNIKLALQVEDLKLNGVRKAGL